MLDVKILCTDPRHPVNAWLDAWAAANTHRATVGVWRDWRELPGGGDFLFLVSCHQIIGRATRVKFRHTLVLHASDLPRGRGMSPHIWQILEGEQRIVVSLINAEDELDRGDIWHQMTIEFDGTELHDEIHAKLFDAEVALMTWALDHCDSSSPRPQSGTSTFYRKRSPTDSAIDPNRPLAESFDLLRVADPERYPAFFEHRGAKYRIRIDRM
jgi:methionyl-tRNA formyltransferase